MHPIQNTLRQIWRAMQQGAPISLSQAESWATVILAFDWAVRQTYLGDISSMLEAVEVYDQAEAGVYDALRPTALPDLRTVQGTTQVWIDRVAAAVDPIQESYRASYGDFFGMIRLPQFPASDGETYMPPDEDLDFETTEEKPTDDPTGGYAVAPLFDVWNYCMDPGTLESGRTWAVQPVQHPTLLYWDPAGTVEPLPPQPAVSWRRLLSAISEPIIAMDFSAVLARWAHPVQHPDYTPQNRGRGWRLEGQITWDQRSTIWTYSVGFGDGADGGTWNWRLAATGGNP